MGIHGNIDVSDMQLADKIFTSYMQTPTTLVFENNDARENYARQRTITYLVRVLGWETEYATRASAIAVER